MRILVISDMQNGFTQESGNLYVTGARNIIVPMNNFLRQVRNDWFDYALIILDTHFAEEYGQSKESTLFPIHCEYGTNDWELSIDVSSLPQKRYLTKNQFNMWSENQVQNIQINDPHRKTAYDNLFHFVDTLSAPETITPRDDFITALKMNPDCANIEVTIIGVASDYCNRYAMEGWLSRGARVIIIRDLTKGIEKETMQILDEDQYQQYKDGRLRAIDSAEYVRELAHSSV